MILIVNTYYDIRFFYFNNTIMYKLLAAIKIN